jgi:hypothetical protein
MSAVAAMRAFIERYVDFNSFFLLGRPHPSGCLTHRPFAGHTAAIATAAGFGVQCFSSYHGVPNSALNWTREKPRAG